MKVLDFLFVVLYQLVLSVKKEFKNLPYFGTTLWNIFWNNSDFRY